MENKKRIYLSSPHLGGTEEEFVKEAFDTNWIAPLGPHVDAFEKEVAELVGVKAAAALSSGTAAIHMAVKFLGVRPGDLVFCSALTFAASCNPIIYEGAEPVFIDSEPDSWNMSPIALEKAFYACSQEGRMPKAVIVVNLYGQSADYDPIMKLCSKYQVPMIEDAAESLGATYKGKYSGTLGTFGIYSFNGNKIITTSGGGMLVSDNEAAVKKVKFWATQARDSARHYQHSELGYNYRMSNVLAAIGRGQLRVLNERVGQKKHINNFYKKALADLTDIEFMPVCGFGQSNYWLTALLLSKNSSVSPEDIMNALDEENIESRPIWKPMQLQPYYEKYRFFAHNDEKVSISENVFHRGLCLPSDTKLTDDELYKVTSIIRKLF